MFALEWSHRVDEQDIHPGIPYNDVGQIVLLSEDPWVPYHQIARAYSPVKLCNKVHIALTKQRVSHLHVLIYEISRQEIPLNLEDNCRISRTHMNPHKNPNLFVKFIYVYLYYNNYWFEFPLDMLAVTFLQRCGLCVIARWVAPAHSVWCSTPSIEMA